MSEAEYQLFAEQFVDMILDSRKPWVLRYLIDGGFQTVPTWEDLDSGKFALDVLHAQREGGRLWEPWLIDALVNADRPLLVPYFKKNAQRKRLPKDALMRLLEMGKSPVLKKSFKALAKPFSSHRGAKPKLPTGKYAEARETADLLEPAILKLLEIPRTSRTLIEILQFLRKDHPKACEFLVSHVTFVQQALDDPGLLKRAKKRIKNRAGVLAAALAGADYGLSLRTSLERVRQARRVSLQKSL
jgi:hypothetical protein